MDLVERAGQIKPMLVDFALSDRFDRELSAVIARTFPDGVITDEAAFSMTVDRFALQHRLRSGTTVVEEFVAAHPELTDAERDMLLGWRDVVESTFEITGKERDAVVLLNFLDELTYRARSNLGHRRLAQQARPDVEPGELPALDFPQDLLAADSVAIHFVAGEGLSFYPGYHLLEELFSNPALISRRQYRETLSGFLGAPDTSPELLRRLAARDPAKASTVFARLLKRKHGFSWAADGEELLRRSKPRYFEREQLPRTVPLSRLLSDALQRDRRS